MAKFTFVVTRTHEDSPVFTGGTGLNVGFFFLGLIVCALILFIALFRNDPYPVGGGDPEPAGAGDPYTGPGLPGEISHPESR